MRLLLALPAVVYITYGAHLAGYSSELSLGISLFTGTFFLAAIDAPIEALLVANERFDYVTMKNVLNQLTFVIVGGAFMFAGFGYVWLILASLIAQIPQIGFGIWAIHRQKMVPRPVLVSPKRWAFLIRSGLPFGIIS